MSQGENKKYRVVLDTNIYISLYISPHGTLKQITDAIAKKKFITITSPVIFNEISQTLENKFLVPQKDIARLLKFLAHTSEVVVPTNIEKVIVHDPDDDHIIACAVKGSADLIVTGNTKHFRKLKQYKNISIVTPAEFVRMLGGF